MAKRLRLISLICIFVILSISTILSQTLDTKSSFPEEQKSIKGASSFNTETGLLKSSGLAWIRLYQKFISSQDGPSCVFTPSCSQFAAQSIEKFGIGRGTLLAVDRLLRCNPFVGSDHYPLGEEKYLDPVQHYTSRR